MPTIRIMFVGHGPSNLPEDRVVNVFFFNSTVDTPDELRERSINRVADFYNGVDANGGSVSGYLSPWVQRTGELRSYNMADGKPRQPSIQPITLNNTSSTGLPEEVALCLSLHGSPPVSARRRGRIYIGPLGANAMIVGSNVDPARPTLAFKNSLVEAAIRLSTDPVSPFSWCIASLIPTANYVPIVAGYVDNAFDTQRRRGPKETFRTLWTNPSAP